MLEPPAFYIIRKLDNMQQFFTPLTKRRPLDNMHANRRAVVRGTRTLRSSPTQSAVRVASTTLNQMIPIQSLVWGRP